MEPDGSTNYSSVNDPWPPLHFSEFDNTYPVQGNSELDGDSKSVFPGDHDKRCWVCFACEEDDVIASWVKPCRCKGTTKWVHQTCLQRWIDEKQKFNSLAEVSCPQCKTKYIIEFPKMGSMVLFVHFFDNLIHKACPYIASFLIIGSIYSSAVTYGAMTVMQVCGHNEGLTLMEKADPLSLLVGLPAIPVGLITVRVIKWEDIVLKFLRKNTCRIPFLRYLLPCFVFPEEYLSRSNDVASESPPVRELCGALLLPSIATLVGKALFDDVKHNFYRTALGGFLFLTVKGAIKIYHKQTLFLMRCGRRIKDYEEDADGSETGSNCSTRADSVSNIVAHVL